MLEMAFPIIDRAKTQHLGIFPIVKTVVQPAPEENKTIEQLAAEVAELDKKRI
jgi:hypothetical protein